VLEITTITLSDKLASVNCYLVKSAGQFLLIDSGPDMAIGFRSKNGQSKMIFE